jgi:ferredoxin-NADP reductase/MOSC domain-containing protein YiiM
MARLLSVNVGLPRDVSWQGRTVRTAVWKAPVSGPRLVRRLNIDGDGQGDLAGHGGEHRAVFVYQIDSYRYWEKQLDRTDFTYGQFGENFTVDGMADTDVCIGDRFRIGEALFEVTQPRVTCYRVGIRMNNPEMPALLVKHGRPGFYLRVLEEGAVQAGDEILRVATGPERMSVSDINALLYLPGHPRDQLERALRIPALSAGWRGSFEALVKQEGGSDGASGNAGLTSEPAPPAWRGFRPLRVARKTRETDNVISLTLESPDGDPVPATIPGQFVVVQLGSRPAPPLMRSYSLSGEPGDAAYRVSIKLQSGAAASNYIEHDLQVGDVLKVSAARGTFTLRAGDAPIVLMSAGIGVTPVLAMLHALATESSPREIWWLYGARNGREHPFAEETQALLDKLSHRHKLICYSAPDSADRSGHNFDVAGRLDMAVVEGLGLPADGDFYVCGPTSFMDALTSGLTASGISPDHIHTEIFGGATSITPGIASPKSRPPPHSPAGPEGEGPQVSFARSGLNVRWDARFHTLLELAEACDVPVRWSCRIGVCHMCETALVAGRVAYSPAPLDAPADGNVLICCSQPGGDLVIDL